MSIEGPAVLVHGVPDTARMWDALGSHLRRRDVVTPSLPGFGVPVPAGFAATKEAYVGWLVAEIARPGKPADLVGHDWGSLLVQRVVSIRPDLVRTWACGNGPIDAEYVWHDMAQQWQTPGVGEQIMAMMTPDAMAEGLAGAGIPIEVAGETASHVDATMKDCILRLFAERLAARVRGKLRLFEGWGHWWPIERPTEAAAALEELWAATP